MLYTTISSDSQLEHLDTTKLLLLLSITTKGVIINLQEWTGSCLVILSLEAIYFQKVDHESRLFTHTFTAPVQTQQLVISQMTLFKQCPKSSVDAIKIKALVRRPKSHVGKGLFTRRATTAKPQIWSGSSILIAAADEKLFSN